VELADSEKRRRNVYDKKPQRYVKDNRTAHLTARSDKSVAYVTNNKRLYSAFFTVEANYWQTQSVAQPLCDSRATCWPSDLNFHPKANGMIQVRDIPTEGVMSWILWSSSHFRPVKKLYTKALLHKSHPDNLYCTEALLRRSKPPDISHSDQSSEGQKPALLLTGRLRTQRVFRNWHEERRGEDGCNRSVSSC